MQDLFDLNIVEATLAFFDARIRTPREIDDMFKPMPGHGRLTFPGIVNACHYAQDLPPTGKETDRMAREVNEGMKLLQKAPARLTKTEARSLDKALAHLQNLEEYLRTENFIWEFENKSNDQKLRGFVDNTLELEAFPKKGETHQVSLKELQQHMYDMIFDAQEYIAQATNPRARSDRSR